MSINSNEVAKGLAGLPSVEKMLSPEHFDNQPAIVRSMDGTKESPAALTEGEIVISIPAIIAMGKGDFNVGAQKLTQLHDLLREESKKYIDQKGLAAAGLGEA